MHSPDAPVLAAWYAQMQQELSEHVVALEIPDVHASLPFSVSCVQERVFAQEIPEQVRREPVEVLRALSQDRIQQRTAERTAPPDR